MKKIKNTLVKLTKKDYQDMWGEDGPYSQVRLSEEIRILDDAISRVFLVVEVEINPFTFEWATANKDRFKNDIAITQLLENAQFRGDYGYVVSAGEVKLDGEKSKQFARKQALMATETVIRLHTAVIDEFKLRHPQNNARKLPHNSTGTSHVWNDAKGQVEIVPVSADAQLANGGNRFLCFLKYGPGFTFDKKSVQQFSLALEETTPDFAVKIENCESFAKYMLLTVHTTLNTPPTKFIEGLLTKCNQAKKKPMFQNDFIITDDEDQTMQPF